MLIIHGSRQITYISGSLHNGVAGMATAACSVICQTCGTSMVDHRELLINVVRSEQQI